MILSTLVTLAGVVGTLAAPGAHSPAAPALRPRDKTSSTGSDNGFFYVFWTDGAGDVEYNNGEAGSYAVSWEKSGNFFGGKGWKPGAQDLNVTFSADFRPEGNGYLSVYGFGSDPLVEYYIVEDFGTYDPVAGFDFASGLQTRTFPVEVDGGRYTVGAKKIVRMDLGAPVLTQLWSVRHRDDRRSAGTVRLRPHFDAWRDRLNITVGALDYSIVATEGYMSSGSAEVVVEAA